VQLTYQLIGAGSQHGLFEFHESACGLVRCVEQYSPSPKDMADTLTRHVERHLTSGETVRDIAIGPLDGQVLPIIAAMAKVIIPSRSSHPLAG
jgi:hypothetical protein